MPRGRDDSDLPTPMSRKGALDQGVSVDALRGPSYQRVLYNAYLRTDTAPTVRQRALAALVHCSPAAFASHFTAAEYWGLWVPDDPEIHVSGPKNAYLTKCDGVRRHLAHIDTEVVTRGELRLSSPIQTFLSLAKWVGLVDLVVLGDSIVHHGFACPEELIQRADTWPGHCARKARRAARLVRAGVDSPMETRLRMLVVLADLPEPVVNHVLLRPDGSWWMRFDLSYPPIRTALEYDGRQHADSPEQWQHDLERREQMDLIDWRLLVVRAPGIYNRPDKTLARVTLHLEDRGMKGLAPPSDEWRRHFPVRGIG